MSVVVINCLHGGSSDLYFFFFSCMLHHFEDQVVAEVIPVCLHEFCNYSAYNIKRQTSVYFNTSGLKWRRYESANS